MESVGARKRTEEKTGKRHDREEGRKKKVSRLDVKGKRLKCALMCCWGPLP